MNPVLQAIRDYVGTTTDGDHADIYQRLNELTQIVGGPPDAHQHPISEVVDLTETLAQIQEDLVSDTGPSPNTLVRRNEAGEIDTDTLRVNQLQPVAGTGVIFSGSSIDMQGHNVLNSNLPLRYEHIQSVSSQTWTIVHNFGRYPAGVTVYSTAGKVILATTFNTDLNTTKVQLSTPATGKVAVIG